MILEEDNEDGDDVVMCCFGCRVANDGGGAQGRFLFENPTDTYPFWFFTFYFILLSTVSYSIFLFYVIFLFFYILFLIYFILKFN